jgi:hypothetical protein
MMTNEIYFIYMMSRRKKTNAKPTQIQLIDILKNNKPTLSKKEIANI